MTRMRLWMTVIGVAAITSAGPGCRAPQPVVPPMPGAPAAGREATDAARRHLTLDQIPGDPEAPPVVNLATRPAMSQAALTRYQDARALCADGRYAEAVVELEKALRYDQNQHELQRWLCIACYFSGSEGRARLRARETLRLFPQDLPARFVLGRLALKADQKEEALREFRTALKAPPDPEFAEYRALVHLHLGLLLDDLGFARAALDQLDAFERARSRLTEAQRKNPELQALAHSGARTLDLRRGRLLARLERYREAAEAMAAAAAEAPGDVALQTEYAQVLVRARRPAEALATAQRVVREQKASKPSVDLLISVRRWTNQTGRIPADLQALSDQYPERLDLALDLARILIDLKKPDAAALVLRSAQRRHPHQTEPAWMLAELLCGQGRWREWLVALADAMTAREDQYVRVEQAVAALPEDARLDRALLERIVAEARGQPGEPARLFVAAKVAEKLKDAATAERLLRRSVELNPKGGPARVALGELLLRRCAWDEVIKLTAEAEKAGLGGPQMEWLLGQAYEGLDDYEAARRHYEAALKLNPRHARALFSLAMLTERTGDAVKAQSLYRQVLDIDAFHIAARERLLRICIARGELAAATAQLLEIKDRAGASSPAYQRNEALVRFIRRQDPAGYASYRDEIGRIVQSHPRDVRSREEYLGVLYAMRDYEEAARQVEETIRIDPDCELALELRAALEARRLEFDSAAATLRRLLDRHPRREGWWRNLVELYLVELKYDRALDAARRLVELPGGVRHRRTLLEVYRMAGRLPEMRDQAEKWLADAPRDEGTRALVLFADEARKDRETMVRRCRAWMAEDPHAARLWRVPLASALVALKRFDEAQAEVLGWMEADPGDTQLLSLYAEVLDDGGRPEDALEWARTVMAGEPQLAGLLYPVLLRIHHGSGDYEGAIQVLRQLTRDAMRSGEGRGPRAATPSADEDEALGPAQAFGLELQVGALLAEANRFEEAEAHLNRLAERVDRPAERAQILRQLSYVYQRQKKLDLAEQRLREAYELAPGDPGINNDLGYTLAEANRDLDDAERMVRLAVGEAPRQAAYLDSLGWVYFKKGRFEEARTWLLRAAAQPDENDVVIQDHLGDTCFRLGRIEEARASWQAALDIAAEEPIRPGDQQRAEVLANVRAKLRALELGAVPAVARTAAEARAATRPGGPSPAAK